MTAGRAFHGTHSAYRSHVSKPQSRALTTSGVDQLGMARTTSSRSSAKELHGAGGEIEHGTHATVLEVVAPDSYTQPDHVTDAVVADCRRAPSTTYRVKRSASAKKTWRRSRPSPPPPRHVRRPRDADLGELHM